MSITTVFGRLAAEYANARNRYLTERQVRALPREIQKDIGWPDVYERNDMRRISLGAWAGER
ncbi:MAG: hypothetical protein KF914_13970 [Rhizobiaceae bacterium]|nr:hypothetical protein [Rhizobiaceae bacterium]